MRADLKQELFRVALMLRYLNNPSQYLLIRRTNLDRRKTLESLGIDLDRCWKPVMRRVRGDGVASPASRLSDLDEQEFVKYFVVGAARPTLAHVGSLRNIVWRVLHEVPIDTYLDYVSPHLTLNTLGSVINGVHGPISARKPKCEMQFEVSLIPRDDLILFSEIVKRTNERMKLPS